MKKLLPVVLLFCLVATVYAVFISTETFDSYSTSADLNGLGGGAVNGWTGNWTGTAARWSIQTAPAGGQGGNAARNQTALDTMSRAFSDITAGTISFKMRLSITNPSGGDAAVILTQTDGKCYIRFGPTGNIEIFDNTTPPGSYVTIQAYSANTWYTIDVDFDCAAQPNLYRARVNGGTYTGYKATATAFTALRGFRIDASATGTRDFWIDDIKAPSAGGASIVPVISGVLSRRRNQ